MTVSDDLKTALNNILNMKDKSSGSYDGMKFENDNQKGITINSDITFKKNGEEWVPTTLHAFVVNQADLQRNTKIKFQQTIIGASESVAINLPALTKRPPPNEMQITKLFPDVEFVNKIFSQMSATLSDPAQMALTAKRQMVQMNQTSRLIGTTYQNTNKYPIVVTVNASNRAFGGECALFGFIDDQLASLSIHGGFGPECLAELNVYPTLKYRIEASPKTMIRSWTEIR
jgi:hypothetical protein